jgi:hypothetical protein
VERDRHPSPHATPDLACATCGYPCLTPAALCPECGGCSIVPSARVHGPSSEFLILMTISLGSLALAVGAIAAGREAAARRPATS